MRDEAMDDIEPFMIPTSYLRADLIPREYGNLADEVKVRSCESDPASSSNIVRTDHQRAFHAHGIKDLGVGRITEMAIIIAIIESCPALGHDSQVERVLANWRKGVEILGRCRITDHGGEGECAHAGTPSVPSYLDHWPKYDGVPAEG